MTPPAVSQAAASPTTDFRPVARELVGPSVAQALDPRTWSRIRVLVDFVVLYLAASAALFAAPHPNGAPERWLAAAFPLVTLAAVHLRRNPDERLHASVLDTITHVLGAVSCSAVLMIAADSALSGRHPLALALRLWLFAFVYLGLARLVLLSIRSHAVRNEALAIPTLIVGAGMVGEHLVKRLVDDRGYGLRPVGFLDSDPLPVSDRSRSNRVPLLGGPDDLTDAIILTGARHVILAFSSEPDHLLVNKVGECQRMGAEVSLVPRLYESINERATLDHVGGMPVVSLRPTNPRSWEFGIKHALDRTFAALAVLAMSPVLIAIAIAVRATSPGPAFFRQRRVGRDGRVFDVFKFRTMREPPRRELEEYEFELPEGCAPGGVEGEDRRTKLGRWLRESSLDELPQLINVLRGDMSLVGPRPERPEFVERFSMDVNRYQDRHRVKSGITGWAQVNGLRGQTSIADRVEWDNFYIQNWSLWLDLRIIALTIAEVMRLRG